MGLFNTVRVRVACTKCHALDDAEVQFKYGDLHCYGYGLGSMILRADEPPEATVAAQGLHRCSRCDARMTFDVIIAGGAIRSVGVNDGTHDYQGELYLVIK